MTITKFIYVATYLEHLKIATEKLIRVVTKIDIVT